MWPLTTTQILKPLKKFCPPAGPPGIRARLAQADVSNQAEVERIVADTIEEFGKLDMAVSNAAYSDRQPFYEADMDGFRRTINVTMSGHFYPGPPGRPADDRQAAGRRDRRHQLATRLRTHPATMAYNMSKAAIDHMARTAAIELVEHKIRVNIVHPGWIDTPGERKFADEEAIQNGRPQASRGPHGHARGDRPRRRLLVHPASDYITGIALAIDGGITLPWWAKNRIPDREPNSGP